MHERGKMMTKNEEELIRIIRENDKPEKASISRSVTERITFPGQSA